MRITTVTIYVLLMSLALSYVPLARACDEIASTHGLPVTSFAIVGKSMQQVLLALPPPAAVYLAGEDAELPRQTSTDPVVFRYELTVDLAGDRLADVFVRFDADTYVVESATVALREHLPLETIIDVLELEHRRERRRVATDDIDIWVTDEAATDGQAEVVVFPELGLEVVQIDGLPVTSLSFGTGGDS